MEIPGYYFDPLKNKYFKIQRNHVAPPDSKYSIEAINEQNLRIQTEENEEEKRFQERSQRLKHDRRIYHPLTSLQYRLGNNGPGSTTSFVSEYYGASISPRPVLGPGKSSTPHFSCGPTNTLIVGMRDTKHSPWAPTSLVSLRRDRDCQGKSAWSTGNRDEMVQTPGKIASLIFTDCGLLAWTEDPGATGNAQLHIARLDYATDDVVYHSQHNIRNEQRMQLTTSPGGNYWLGWTSSTIFLRPAMYTMLYGYPIVLTSLNHLKKKDSLLTVAFKDEWVLMAGHRSGFVNFLDHREGSEAQVRRMRHDNPLNALRILKDSHTLLASGLTSTALYDLRYLAAPRTSKKSERCSTPVLRFSTPQTSDRLELGVDYNADLNMVAIASSRNRTHHVTLYSTRTGRAIPSALDRAFFDGPVPCLKFHYTSDGQYSLLMAPESEEPTLIEWACDV